MSLTFSFTGGALPAGATLTRSTTGYATAVGGSLTSYAVNAPRWDYDPITHAANGILIEPAATNLLLQSNALDQAPWGAGGGGSNPAVGANVATAPDGTNTADSIIAGTTNGNQHRTQNVSVPAAGTYTMSAYFKANQYTNCSLGSIGTGNFPVAYFNLTSGLWTTIPAAITSTTAKLLANSWYWLSITYAVDAGHISNGQHSCAFTNGGTISFQGDGVKNGYCWGAQVESGSVPTSPIPTGAATAARGADVLTLAWGTTFGLPDGPNYVRYTFDDNSFQDVLTTISGGNAVVPTNLNRPRIKSATAWDAATPAGRRVTLTEAGPKYVGL